MFAGLTGITEAGLKQWIEDSLANHTNILAAGYQGQTLEYQDANHHLVIKVPHGRGLLKQFHISMLRHENQVYQHLSKFPAIPGCYGLVDNQYLVLEFIQGQPFRSQRPEDEVLFFKTFLQNIHDMHEMGVAHFDLKKRDNLLVIDGKTPCLIDFGAAIIQKQGFHPLNALLFNMASRFDYNAWIKLKYNNQFQLISEEDRQYYSKTKTEIVSRKIKRFYKDRVLKLFK